jgi:hypothetical protein
MRGLALVAMWGLLAGEAWAGVNHAQASYRALEKMPEVAHAPRVNAEPLDAFLKAEEKTLEALLASHEAWAIASLDNYPPRPDALAFVANPGRSDEARRQAFLTALRVAPNSKWTLYVQPDAQEPPVTGGLLAWSDVSTVPASSVPRAGARQFVALRPGELVSALTVVATATDEPDYGLDAFLWDDSPGPWGRQYGLGPQPFGNPALVADAQAPFNRGFFYEDRVLLSVAPWATRSMVLSRFYQYSSLASLAFRTGHEYWGWRFAGLALHYVQALTQPFHASLAPGESTAKLLGYYALSRVGLPRLRNEQIRLITNRRIALDLMQAEWLDSADKALQASDKDRGYPEWNDRYVRDVVAAQSAATAPRAQTALLASLPPEWVSDPQIDLQALEPDLPPLEETLRKEPAKRTRLQALLAEWMGNFGAHSRNALRAIVKSGNLY